MEILIIVIYSMGSNEPRLKHTEVAPVTNDVYFRAFSSPANQLSGYIYFESTMADVQ